MPRKYDPAIKERARRMIAEQAVELGSVSRACEVVGAKLGIGKETLRGWARQADIDAGTRSGNSSEDSAQIKDLKAKVRSLEEENAILRSAATYAGDRCQVGAWSSRLRRVS
ncbi:MAG: hypothetical protein H5T76_03795 [Streptomyces sp.]|nr:hypothetical protein [Streptomyces sp.]